MIIRKFYGIHIGRALLITDFLIVLIGGVLSGLTILISSFLGLLVKTFGIDLVIALIKSFAFPQKRNDPFAAKMRKRAQAKRNIRSSLKKSLLSGGQKRLFYLWCALRAEAAAAL